MKRKFRPVSPSAEGVRGHLPPPFYSAKDDRPQPIRLSEPPDGNRYLTAGRDDLFQSQPRQHRPAAFGPSGQPDNYRHLGDRRWQRGGDNSSMPQEPWPRGYRPMRERVEGAHDQTGKGPRAYRRSDERILEDLNDRLYDDPWLDASGIEASANAGEITLTGNVPDKAAKRRAEDIAEGVRGVTNVENRLRIIQSSEQ